MAKENYYPVAIKLDFRMFNGRMIEGMKNLRDAVDSEEYKRTILSYLIQQYVDDGNRYQTGALHASYEAAANGEESFSGAYTDGKIVRQANTQFVNGETYIIDPIDEYGNPYAGYQMRNDLTHTELLDKDFRDEIIEYLTDFF